MHHSNKPIIELSDCQAGAGYVTSPSVEQIFV